MKINKYACYTIMFFPILFFLNIKLSHEADIWFLLSHGRYVLENGFPNIEFLTIHNNLHFVMQQWLSSIIFYGIYKYLGIIGIYILVWFTLCIITYLLYKICMKITNNLFLSSIGTTVTVSLLSNFYITCRPNSISIIIFLLELLILESSKKNNKIIYLLVLLSLLEINLHAAMWPILFIILLPYVVEYTLLYLNNKDKRIITILLVFLLMILVGFLNPYGIEAMTYSLNSYGVKDINELIWEMNSFNLLSKEYSIRFYSILTLSIFIIINFIFIKSKKKKNIYILLLFFGTSFMAYLNIRNISLFLICSIPYSLKYIPIKIEYLNNNLKLFYIVLFTTIISIFIFIYSNQNRFILQDSETGQKEILNYLNKHASKKDILYASNIYGGYFEFNGYKSYIDTRAEIFLKKNNHKEDIFHEFYLLAYNKLSYNKFINKYNFNYLIVDKNEYLFNYLKSSNNKDYQLVFRKKKLYLFKKKN